MVSKLVLGVFLLAKNGRLIELDLAFLMGQHKECHVVWARATAIPQRHHEVNAVCFLALSFLFLLLLLTLLLLDINRRRVGILVAAKICDRVN